MKICAKSCVAPVLATFLFLVAYNWLVHTVLLMPTYKEIDHLWRPEADMGRLAWILPFKDLALALLFTCLFKGYRKGVIACYDGKSKKVAEHPGTTPCPVRSGGLCFGVKLGLILAIVSSISYVWLPIPYKLAQFWFLAGLAQGVGVGVVLGMTCRYKTISEANK